MAFDPVTELQRCLALVRPVGMTDSAARDWLTAAVAEVAEFARLRPEKFGYACSDVRKVATHHGQIVPGILAKQFFEWELANGSHRRGLASICAKTSAPALENRGGGVKRIGDLKLIDAPR